MDGHQDQELCICILQDFTLELGLDKLIHDFKDIIHPDSIIKCSCELYVLAKR